MIKLIRKLFRLFELLNKEKRKRKRNFREGRKGELSVYRYLCRMGYEDAIMHDLILRDPKTGVMAQVDILLATKNAVLIIEVKTQNFRCMEGHVDSDSWTVIYGNGKRYASNNIYKQALKQKKVVQSLLKKYGILCPVYSVVFIQNKNDNIQVDIEGLNNAEVIFTTSLDRIDWNSIRKEPHGKVKKVFVAENAKNSYVRLR